ncbi:JmjC domain-containing histone demethylation protein 1 [Geranomyces michiganensis]|nr:JmjC domain-containing histone demethylation protein 1 [Geranomyces michiganensis]
MTSHDGAPEGSFPLPASPEAPELFCYCLTDGTDGEFMIQCIDPPMAAEDTQYCTKFFCKLCEPKHGKSVFKEPTRKSKRGTTQINYNELNEGIPAEEHRFTKILQARTFAQESFKRLKGNELTLKWARKDGLREPVIVESPEGLDIKMPDKDLIVISLEISQTELAEKIRRPRLVRDLDWTEQVWPRERKLANEYPKVQLYCLMSVKDSYTDFHIDFGGSSVFYHLLSGEKIFYFIPPTKINLKKYEKWSSSPDQGHTFLSDEIKGGAIETHLYAGNTMIIPTGWIHAVYTPADSIVIGGNFLQGLNIAGQLEIHGIEERTNVPPKFRFPFFQRMQWYAARRYMAIAKHTPHVLSHWEMEGLDSLIEFLQAAATQMTDVENVKKEERKGLRRHVPTDIKNVQKLLRKLTEHLNAAKLKRNQSALANVRTIPDLLPDITDKTAPAGAVDSSTPLPIPVVAEPISDGEDPQDWHSESEKEYLDSEFSDDSESEDDDYGDESSSADDEAYIPGGGRTSVRKKSDTPSSIVAKAGKKRKSSEEEPASPEKPPKHDKPKRPKTQSPTIVDPTISDLTREPPCVADLPSFVHRQLPVPAIPPHPHFPGALPATVVHPQPIEQIASAHTQTTAAAGHHQPLQHVTTPLPQLAGIQPTTVAPSPLTVAPISHAGEGHFPTGSGTEGAGYTANSPHPETIAPDPNPSLLAEAVAPKPREKKKPPTVKQRLNKLLNKKRR